MEAWGHDRLEAADFDDEFREAFPVVLNAAFLIVGDREAALELTQDAFVELYRNWDKVSRYEQPRAWVRRVAIRLALRYRRREEARPVPVPLESPANAVDQRLWLLWALERLSPAQRAAAVLFYLEDLTVDDVAHAMGCGTATVKVHLHKARRRLAELLQPDQLRGHSDVG